MVVLEIDEVGINPQELQIAELRAALFAGFAADSLLESFAPFYPTSRQVPRVLVGMAD
jgi:hypothetical protein